MAIPHDFFYALVIMNVLFVTGAWSLARPSLTSSGLLVAVALAWVVGNGPIEGRVLISFNVHHGLTESDILSAIAVVIAAVGAWRARRAKQQARL